MSSKGAPPWREAPRRPRVPRPRPRSLHRPRLAPAPRSVATIPAGADPAKSSRSATAREALVSRRAGLTPNLDRVRWPFPRGARLTPKKARVDGRSSRATGRIETEPPDPALRLPLAPWGGNYATRPHVDGR